MNRPFFQHLVKMKEAFPHYGRIFVVAGEAGAYQQHLLLPVNGKRFYIFPGGDHSRPGFQKAGPGIFGQAIVRVVLVLRCKRPPAPAVLYLETQFSLAKTQSHRIVMATFAGTSFLSAQINS